MKMRVDLKDEVKNSLKILKKSKQEIREKSINLIKNANKARN